MACIGFRDVTLVEGGDLKPGMVLPQGIVYAVVMFEGFIQFHFVGHGTVLMHRLSDGPLVVLAQLDDDLLAGVIEALRQGE